MIVFWDAACMIAAVLAWVPILKWQRSRQRRIAVAALATAGMAWGSVLLGWSPRGVLADDFALPVLLLTTVVGLTALFCLVRPPFRSLLLTLVCIAGFLSWGALGLIRGFSDAPPVKTAELLDGYHYDIRISGMAFTEDMVVTRVKYSPAWLPFFERTATESWVEGPEGGLIGRPEALAATPKDGLEGRHLLVTYEGKTIDRLAY